MPPSQLYCHEEFLNKLHDPRTQSTAKRANLLLERLLIDSGRLHFKSTQGENNGWRRSRLGGTGGCQFYAWWAPHRANPVRAFESEPGAVFVRDIRHHDNHTPLYAGDLLQDYYPIDIRDLRREDDFPSPWTPQQFNFVFSTDTVRILKGHPGSGKTSALLHAVDQSGASNILYLTYNSDLASLARSFFDRYCSHGRRCEVKTFPRFIRDFVGVDSPIKPLNKQRDHFRRETIATLRGLAPWSQHNAALFDEFHAHIVGAALPVALGRFGASVAQRECEGSYIARRSPSIGSRAASAAATAARRLELAIGALAPEFFPDLHMAQLAVAQLAEKDLPWDCIAVDECQDLTPIECFFLARLAKHLASLRGHSVPVLLAGDEAQTVRPTDFEWGWLSDIFHEEVATPVVENLTTNLRSPRQIAELINSVWGLYAHLDRRERPSGQGWATIDDQAPDQILYCAASDGDDLAALMDALSHQEGLAIVSFQETQALAPTALAPAEIKGLDFHSVCVINPGEQLQRIAKTARPTAGDLEGISRRLAIDELRVAVSRPTERLIWLDVRPTAERLHASLDFLRQTIPTLAALTPRALLTSLQEESLDLAERIQRCQDDARQYLPVRPDLAWSRAHQAVSLLGAVGDVTAVTDQVTRESVYLTLAQVCFSLAMRNQTLSPELGNPNLLKEASIAAAKTSNIKLTTFLNTITEAHAKTGCEEVDAIIVIIATFPQALPELPPWVLLELGNKPQLWLSILENLERVGSRAARCAEILPTFYRAIDLPEADLRSAQLLEKTVTFLIGQAHFNEALVVLAMLPERNHQLEAHCHQKLGNFTAAASAYRAAGDLQNALECYRRVPDITQALEVIAHMDEPHVAIASLEWIAAMQSLAVSCPSDFQTVITPEERTLLESVLQPFLGGQRRRLGGRA